MSRDGGDESGGVDLQRLRERIEELDQELLRLLRRRLEVVEEVVSAKLASAWPFRDAAREERLLLALRHRAVEEGLDPHEIERLFRVVLDLSVAHQRAHVRSSGIAPLRIGYQGAEGSYSHLAAQRRYAGRPSGVLLSGFVSFREAADGVRAGDLDLALLPIENTTAGSINETYDLLAEGDLVITGEVISGIEHCLLALPGVALGDLCEAHSHPQALRQCEGFFRDHPGIRAVEEYDTAGAARKVRERGDRSIGAIASFSAAAAYGLEVLLRGIQSEAGNATRFVEVSLHPEPVPDGAAAKTSLVVELADRPGALGDLLQLFGARGLSLTKLESRPIPKNPWRYRFYLDVAAHSSLEPFPSVLEAAKELVADLKILGTYPSATPPTGASGLGPDEPESVGTTEAPK